MVHTRKRNSMAGVTLVLTMALTSFLHAGAYEWGGLGTRAQSMGGAFIGLADDWTALYWNPAGLTQLEGSGVGLDFISPHITMKDGSSMSNLPVGQMDTRYQRDVFANYTGLGAEPSSFNETTVKHDFYVPEGIGGYWQAAGLTLAAGYYVPVGYYIDWEDTLAQGTGTMTGDLFQELSVMAFNFSVAKRLHPKLSLGAGVELMYGKIDYQAHKTIADSSINDYVWSFDSDCDGTGLEGILAFLYDFTDQLSLGGVYRTGATLDLEGKASTSLDIASLSEASDFDQTFHHPSTYGVGLAYRCSPQLTATCDWQRTLWSEFRIEVDYDTPGAALQNQDYSEDWHDSNRYRLGVEWKANPKWVVRGGYFFDESPLPDKAVSLSHIVGVDRQNIMLGVGHALGKGWVLDTVLHHAWGSRSVTGIDYRQEVTSVGFSIGCNFQ